jgi:putative sigma-54 modulation protein
MKVRIIGKNVSITKGIKAYAMKKISKLEKYIIVPEDISVRVLIRTYKTAQKVEVTIPTKFGVLRAESKGEDAYAALDLAVDKLADQIRRQKTCIQRRNKESLTDAFLMEEDAEPDAEIKTKIVDIHHMSADEAFVNCFRQRDST